jgi:hypothetical protein
LLSDDPGIGDYSVKIGAVPGFLFFKNPKKLSGYTLLKSAGEKSGGFAQNAARPGISRQNRGLRKKHAAGSKKNPAPAKKRAMGKNDLQMNFL